MSKLNSELNDKITDMNKDFEVKNAEHYTATVRAQHTEELELALNTELAKTQAMEKKVAKAVEEKARLEALEEVSRVSQEALRLVEEQLSTIDHPNSKSLLTTIQRIRHELKTATSLPRNPKDDPVFLKNTIKQLQTDNSALEAEHKRLVSIEHIHLDRISTLEKEINKLRNNSQEGNANLTKKLAILTENAEKFRIRAEKAEELYEKTEIEHQKHMTQFVNLQNKHNALKTANTEAKNTIERLENTLKDLKTQLLASKNQQNSQISGLLNREQKLKMTAAKLKSLTDEVWKKETELLRKEGHRLKLEQELKLAKEQLQQGQVTAKQKAAEDYTVIEAKLVEKDREIGILKDMLRSSTHQVKHRDIDISRIKMRMEAASPQREDRSSSPATERTGKASAIVLELDGLVSVKERMEQGGTRLPQNVIRKRVKEDVLPSTNADLQTLIGRKVESGLEELRKEAKNRGEAVMHVKALWEKMQSQAVRELLGESSMRLSEVAERLTSLSAKSSD